MTNQRKDLLKLNDGIITFSGSSLSDLSCHRKAYYKHELGIVPESGTAAKFGTAIHYALAEYYKTPWAARSVELLIKAFTYKWDEVKPDSDDELRNISTAIKILTEYEKTFNGDERYKVYCDDQGPFVERTFDVAFLPGINITGTIDLVVEDTFSGDLLVMDHKTSRSLGQEFINKHRMSAQFAGYCFAVSALTGRNVDRYIVNGIQVAKTKQTIFRLVGDISSYQKSLYMADVEFKVKNYVNDSLKVRALDSQCSAYGGCPFLDACSASHQDLATNLLNSMKVVEDEN